MNYQIIDVFKDPANKFRITVSFNYENNSYEQIFKFASFPTEEMIEKELQKLVILLNNNQDALPTESYND